MADPRFFKIAGPFSLRELAALAGGEVGGAANPDRQFSDVAPLESAGEGDVSFLDNKRYLPAFETSKAGACVVAPAHAARAPAGMALILTDNPYRGYALVARAFYPEAVEAGGIHASAVIDATAAVGEGTEIGAYAVIGPRVRIGPRCRIAAHVVIGEGVEVGAETVIGPGASLDHCLIGERCNLHAGVRIGNRGFGFTLDPDGYLDVPQLGRAIIEDDVEIGANSTVDRGAGPDTVIGAGAKIDNLVQIGHNVCIGRGCVLVAQSGVAGSSKLEDYVMLGAQGGIAGHLTIGKGAQVAAQSGVMRDVPPGQSVCGAPAIPIKDFFRLVGIQQRHLKASRKRDD